MRLTKKIKILLKDAVNFCDANEKSTAYMLQYMQDVAKVDLDTVLKFLKTHYN